MGLLTSLARLKAEENGSEALINLYGNMKKPRGERKVNSLKKKKRKLIIRREINCLVYLVYNMIKLIKYLYI